MKFGCRKCNRSFEELFPLGKLEEVKDSHWICIDCNNDLTRDPKTVYREAIKLADLLWGLDVES